MTKEVPNFIPRNDQVDFSNIRWAPVVNCVIVHKDKFLIVKRNSKLNFYPGYWNGVSGFLDDKRSLKEKVTDEITQELGVGEDALTNIRLCGIFDQEEPDYNKTWIVHAVRVELHTDDITLDWESEDYAWVTIDEVGEYPLLPGFDQVLSTVFKE